MRRQIRIAGKIYGQKHLPLSFTHIHPNTLQAEHTILHYRFKAAVDMEHILCFQRDIRIACAKAANLQQLQIDKGILKAPYEVADACRFRPLAGQQQIAVSFYVYAPATATPASSLQRFGSSVSALYCPSIRSIRSICCAVS